MSNLEEINERIRHEQKDAQRLRKAARRSDARKDDLIRAVDEARDRLRAKRKRRQALRDEDVRRDRKGNPWTDEQRERLLDGIADDIEDAEDVLDELVERLDSRRLKLGRVKARLREHEQRLDRLREKRRRIRREREGRLSEHFHRAEFDCRDGTRVPDAAIPALRALCQDVLEPQRRQHGAVRITSGYRHRGYNASIGGAPNSIHCYEIHRDAVAADHTCARGSARSWFDATAGKASGRGLYSSFHHADNRHRIGWGWSTWSG